MSAMGEAQALAARMESELQEEDASNARKIAVKRALFSSFATVWNNAEDAGEKDVVGKELPELRPKLKLHMPKMSVAARLSMYVRMALMLVVFVWGGLCVVALTPLRWFHPVLRRCGARHDWLPVNLCFSMWCYAMLAAAGVKIKFQGKPMHEQWGNMPCGIIVYNHASNLDPFIVYAACSQLAPKFVGKKVLFKLPVFGWLCFAMGNVPIDRKNRDKAVHTMNTVAGGIVRKGRSVAVAPEGARTKDGHLLLPFKKGTFHFQAETGAPLLPVVLHGAYDLWPPRQLFTRTGEVHIMFLEPQHVGNAAGSHEALEEARVRLQRSMAECAVRFPDASSRHPLSWQGAAECCFGVFCTLCVFLSSWRFYSALIATIGLSHVGVACILVITALAVAVGVDFFV